MNQVAEDILMHYGMPRRSGRYPWGSGDEPYQRTADFLSRVEALKKDKSFKFTDEDGKTYTGEQAIYKSMGLTSSEYRREISICKDQRTMTDISRAKSLRDDGLGPTAIAKAMGLPPSKESTVREWLKPDADKSYRETKRTVDFLREQVDKKGMIDVGRNAEKELGVSPERFKVALHYLQTREGYHVYGGRMDQINNNMQKTTQKVLCVPGTKHSEIYDLSKVHSMKDYVSHDNGETFDTLQPPKSFDSKRLKIRYNEEGGLERDGIVEIRRGVEDISLGNDRYSQVRILVDGTHYIKGMAVYSDDMPPGVDMIFNTNKPKGTPQEKVLKEIKNDPDNPFGSLIKAGGQSYYIDENGNRQLRVINKTRGEGDWEDWTDALPSQFLAKQSKSLAKKQLALARLDKQDEFEEICSIPNPTLKKHLLEKFADGCDASAVHLKAAALPGQKHHVIIPINSLSDNEVYAPRYENGTKLALIRYPHAGTFEIPILTVNNRHAAARKLLGTDITDAVGINKNNADRLSGADFDGDTVMCIPAIDKSGRKMIQNRDPLKGLEGFDPKLAYGPETYAGYSIKYMKDPVTGKDNTQREMGVISNLITDMTLAGAPDTDMAKAVRHSMVVIDAGKHKLNYKKSEEDNNIAALKKEYQRTLNPDGTIHYGGASTLLSRSKGEATVDRRQGSPYINMPGKKGYDPSRPEGAKMYNTSDDLYYPDSKFDKKTRTYTLPTTIRGKKVTYNVDDREAVERYKPVQKKDSNGKPVFDDDGYPIYTNKAGDITYRTKKRTQKSTNMAETDDAYTLVSADRHQMELVYAEHANSMKALANKARKEIVNAGKLEYSKAANTLYQTEVRSLMSKLNEAEKNTLREREALRRANVAIKEKKETNPDLTKDDIRKYSTQSMNKARASVGSLTRKKRNIDITDREWEAIQAGAISENQLKRIFNNTDIDKLREKATPKATVKISSTKVSRIKAMSASNHTIAEIAKALGISESAVSQALRGKE